VRFCLWPGGDGWGQDRIVLRESRGRGGVGVGFEETVSHRSQFAMT
jgi:hypothetical protein